MRDIGSYQILMPLGRGGMAEVFLGRRRGACHILGRFIAIKRILPWLARERQFTAMFMNEARIAAGLSHPNVCQIFELGRIEDELFLSMEYLEGVSWAELVAAAPRDALLPLTAGVLGQAAEGLHHAHTFRDASGAPSPIVHRDVSPENLYVTVDGVCKVLDFGVAKVLFAASTTRSGVLKGKLPYMAPEQILGQPLDARADVFALGVCAWEALAGESLFDRDSDYEIWKAIVEEGAPPLSSRWPACPPLLEAVIARALSRDPADRQSSARAFAAELRNAAGDPADAAEIAVAVRSSCADRLADRKRAIAAAVTVADRDTAWPAASVEMRRESIAIGRLPTAITRTDAPAPRRRTGLIFAAIATAAAAAIIAVLFVVARRADPPPPPPPPPAPARSNLGTVVERLDEAKRRLLEVRDQLAPLTTLDAEVAAPEP